MENWQDNSDMSEGELEIKMEPSSEQSSSDESILTTDTDEGRHTTAVDRVSPVAASREVALPSSDREKEGWRRGVPAKDLDRSSLSADDSTASSRDDDTDDDSDGSGMDAPGGEGASKDVPKGMSKQCADQKKKKAGKGAGKESGGGSQSCEESSINDWDRQIYRCMKCGMAFSQHNHLVKHLLVHTFKCKHCGQQFSSDEDLLEHEDCHRVGNPQQERKKSDQRLVQSQGQKHVCHECDLEFCDISELMSHWERHIFACSFCRRTFTSQASLLKHEREHTEAEISCKDCGKVFQRTSNLKVHMMKYCQGNPSSTAARSLADATDSEHEFKDNKSKTKEAVGQKNVFDLFKLPVKEEVSDDQEMSGQAQSSSAHQSDTCYDVDMEDSDDDVIICDETYTQPQRSPAIYFNCPKCPQAFSRKSDFVRHVKTHSSEKRKNSCSDTAKKLSSPARQHAASTSDFRCETCQISYATESELQKHMSKHKYLCDKCDQTFTSIKKLKHHMALHNADQVHECNICQRQYSKARFLQRHKFLRHPNAKCISSQQRPKAQITSGCKKVPSKSRLAQANGATKLVPPSPNRRLHIPASPRRDRASVGQHTQKGSPSKKRKFASLSDKELYSAVNPAEYQTASRRAQFTCRPCKKSYSRQCDLTKHQIRAHAKEFMGHKTSHSPGATKEKVGAVQKMSSPSLVVARKHDRRVCRQREVSESAEGRSDDQDCKPCKQVLPKGNEKSSSHKTKIELTCDKCGKSFSCGEAFNKHKDTDVFMCRKCQRFFTTCISLEEHKRNYHGQGSDSQQGEKIMAAHKETGEGIKFKRTNKGMEGTAVASEKHDQQLRCRTCHRQFKRRCDLSRHVHASHGQSVSSDDESETEVTMSVLPSRGQQGLRSSDHALSNERRRRSDSRRDCEKAVGSAKRLYSQKRPEPVSLKFTCNVCSKTFKELEELTNHQQAAKHTTGRKQKAAPPAAGAKAAAVSSDEEYSCELCQEVFATEAQLEEHQEYHTLSEFGSEAKDEWDETIVSQRSLMVKRKKELREELFICRFCDQTFSSLEHVHRHERSHPYMAS